MKSTYEITYLLVVDEDGLVSHAIKGVKEIVTTPDDDNDEDNDDK